MGQTVQNIISEDETSYIRQEKLEARLFVLFGYPIKVSHINGRYVFEAPRKVDTVKLADPFCPALGIQDEIAPSMAGPDSGYHDSLRPYLRYDTFVSHPEKSNIYVFESTPHNAAHSFNNSEIFESHIANRARPDARIVSISCQNSLRPLGITDQAMRKLMNRYDIDGSFFDLVISFGDKPRSSDAGHGAMSVKRRDDGSYDMQYLFTYAENDSSRNAASWRIRQVCLFHRYDPSGAGNLWILLHASPDSKLQRQIELILSTNPSALLADWSSMHLLVLSTYLSGWRWCIRNLGDEIERTVDIALTLDFSKPKARDHKDGLVQLLKQQYLGDRLVPLAARLRAALATLRHLEKLDSLFHSTNRSSEPQYQPTSDQLAYHITSLEGHIESVQVLEAKVRGISDLLAVAVTVENQAVTIDINNKMLALTNKSLDENATVRIVTLVTLIYLPASFVSTLLGMNLFDFGDEGNLEISHHFWIFIVLAVPLTVLTVGSWYWLKRRRQKQREQSRIADLEGQ
ncbi:hypothetical protein BJY01DRAFT_263842 [Aspergillus pseudoustus]|uniref:CorA-like transporter domain-containing protein n=1 Tax=Aspergillus pseudoustus TaxID=1810923 RepID=A0ABR4JWY2_9EURO